jgi:hypothetical protein
LDRLGWAAGTCFVSHGLRIGIRVNDPAVLDRLPVHLPPGWKPARTAVVDRLYSLRVGGPGKSAAVRRYHLLYAGAARLARSLHLEELLEPFENDLQLYVAEWARRRVFVHAGVVGWRGRAIVIPGRSHSGKTTLVAALVRAGATYYSDEYAVLDTQGRVHPYPRPLSIREGATERPGRHSAEALGGRTSNLPLPIGLVVVTHFREGALWRPRRLTPSQGVLSLVENTVPIRRRPAAAFAALMPAVADATVLRGARGEAAEVAKLLLDPTLP